MSWQQSPKEETVTPTPPHPGSPSVDSCREASEERDDFYANVPNQREDLGL